jgi:hypothetical protein
MQLRPLSHRLTRRNSLSDGSLRPVRIRNGLRLPNLGSTRKELKALVSKVPWLLIVPGISPETRVQLAFDVLLRLAELATVTYYVPT